MSAYHTISLLRESGVCCFRMVGERGGSPNRVWWGVYLETNDGLEIDRFRFPIIFRGSGMRGGGGKRKIYRKREWHASLTLLSSIPVLTSHSAFGGGNKKKRREGGSKKNKRRGSPYGNTNLASELFQRNLKNYGGGEWRERKEGGKEGRSSPRIAEGRIFES